MKSPNTCTLKLIFILGGIKPIFINFIYFLYLSSSKNEYLCPRYLLKRKDIKVANDIVLTPMMKQFLDLKAKHPDAVMLFRCGDFYETYSTDAIVAAEILGITLTKRANGKEKTIEMAGFPYHALDTYLPKLIRAGKRVAICDQLEDPKTTKKLVKRGITELVTPGVS